MMLRLVTSFAIAAGAGGVCDGPDRSDDQYGDQEASSTMRLAI
jgi:hypothetical protein